MIGLMELEGLVGLFPVQVKFGFVISDGSRRWVKGYPPTNICLYYKIKFKQHMKSVAHKIANMLHVARHHNFPLHTLLDLKNYKVQTPNSKI